MIRIFFFLIHYHKTNALFMKTETTSNVIFLVSDITQVNRNEEDKGKPTRLLFVEGERTYTLEH